MFELNWHGRSVFGVARRWSCDTIRIELVTVTSNYSSLKANSVLLRESAGQQLDLESCRLNRRTDRCAGLATKYVVVPKR